MPHVRILTRSCSLLHGLSVALPSWLDERTRGARNIRPCYPAIWGPYVRVICTVKRTCKKPEERGRARRRRQFTRGLNCRAGSIYQKHESNRSYLVVNGTLCQSPGGKVAWQMALDAASVTLTVNRAKVDNWVGICDFINQLTRVSLPFSLHWYQFLDFLSPRFLNFDLIFGNKKELQWKSTQLRRYNIRSSILDSLMH